MMGLPGRENHAVIFSHLDKTRKCDGQADRWTQAVYGVFKTIIY